MCGRYVSSSTPDEIAAHFAAALDPTVEHEASWNVAPTREVLLVGERPLDDGAGDGGERLVRQARWGLVPFWAKDMSIGNKMINARSDKVATSGAYKRSFATKRCIIPADAFYEWAAVPGQKHKQPYLFERADGAPLALAGLWDTWTDAEGHRLRSCVIITTDANDVVGDVHDRMPVILPEERWGEWLDPSGHDTDALQELLVPAPSDLLVVHAVSTDVNNVRNDGPHLVEHQPDPLHR